MTDALVRLGSKLPADRGKIDKLRLRLVFGGAGGVGAT